MTDKLRELFDEMVTDEPPLRITSTATAAAGRRLVMLRRLWMAITAALTVAAVVGVPVLLMGARPAGQVAAALNPPTASPSPTPSLALTRSRHCPGELAGLDTDQSDASVLPAADVAASAVVAQARRIAPGKRFLTRYQQMVPTSAKAPNIPDLGLIFDVGDDDGFGSINLQIRPDVGATPAQRVELHLNQLNQCVMLQSTTFADGSIAIYYPYGPPAQEREVLHVWYFAAGGFTMNIGCFPAGWSFSDDPDQQPPPPPLPVRGDMPLTIEQIMLVADVVAHA